MPLQCLCCARDIRFSIALNISSLAFCLQSVTWTPCCCSRRPQRRTTSPSLRLFPTFLNSLCVCGSVWRPHMSAHCSLMLQMTTITSWFCMGATPPTHLHPPLPLPHLPARPTTPLHSHHLPMPLLPPAPWTLSLETLSIGVSLCPPSWMPAGTTSALCGPPSRDVSGTTVTDASPPQAPTSGRAGRFPEVDRWCWARSRTLLVEGLTLLRVLLGRWQGSECGTGCWVPQRW